MKIPSLLSILIFTSAIVISGCGPSVPELALYLAIEQNDVAAVQAHMDAGTDPDKEFMPAGAEFPGAYALHQAIMRDNKTIAKILLDNDADINITSKDQAGGTPLHWATFWRKLDMVQFLLDARPDVNYTDSNNHSALDIAQADNPLIDETDQASIDLRAKIEDMLKRRGGIRGKAKGH